MWKVQNGKFQIRLIYKNICALNALCNQRNAHGFLFADILNILDSRKMPMDYICGYIFYIGCKNIYLHCTSVCTAMQTRTSVPVGTNTYITINSTLWKENWKSANNMVLLLLYIFTTWESATILFVEMYIKDKYIRSAYILIFHLTPCKIGLNWIVTELPHQLNERNTLWYGHAQWVLNTSITLDCNRILIRVRNSYISRCCFSRINVDRCLSESRIENVIYVD